MKLILKLLRKFLLLSVPLALSQLFAACFPMGFLSAEYPMWLEEKDYVRQDCLSRPSDSSASPSTLILGDSRAKSSLIPGYLPDKESIYNIAIGGATPLEMYYALDNYLKNHDAPENIIIIFAPYHFCEIDNWQQTLYYGYLSLPELLEADLAALTSEGSEAVIYRGFLADQLSFTLRLPNKYMDAILTNRGVSMASSNREVYERVRRDMGYTEFGSEEGNALPNYETHHPVFDKSALVEKYYGRLLDKCLKAGAGHIIIAQAPVNEASSRLITGSFHEGYSEFLSSFEEKYQNYPAFIFESEVPVYDNRYFGDNNHLNNSGARKYTAEFLSRYQRLIF